MRKFRKILIPAIWISSFLIVSMLPLGAKTINLGNSIKNESSLNVNLKASIEDNHIYINDSIANYLEKYKKDILNVCGGHANLSFIQNDDFHFPYLVLADDFDLTDHDPRIELRCFPFSREVYTLENDSLLDKFVSLLPSYEDGIKIGENKNQVSISRLFLSTIKTYDELIELYSGLEIKNPENYFRIKDNKIYLAVFDNETRKNNNDYKLVISENEKVKELFNVELVHENYN